MARRSFTARVQRCVPILATSLGEWPRLPSTARIGRALFHRARSASKEGTWSLPAHPSEAARCASTEEHQPPSSFSCPVVFLIHEVYSFPTYQTIGELDVIVSSAEEVGHENDPYTRRVARV